MITLREFAVAFGAGVFLISLALMPGLFQRFAEGVRNAIESVSFPFAAPQRHAPVETPRLWLATFGIVLILTALLGYTSPRF